MASAVTIEYDQQDYPMFVAPIDDSVVVLCASNPWLSSGAARETARRLIEAADNIDNGVHAID